MCSSPVALDMLQDACSLWLLCLGKFVLIYQLILNVAGVPLSHQQHSDDGELTTSSEAWQEALSELPSWSWWTARVLLMNQRLLARSAASLRSALTTLMPKVRCISPFVILDEMDPSC